MTNKTNYVQHLIYDVNAVFNNLIDLVIIDFVVVSN